MKKSFVILSTMLAVGTHAHAAPFAKYVQGEMLVKFKDNVNVKSLTGLKINSNFQTRFGQFGIVQTEGDVKSAQLELEKHSDVIEYAEPNFIYSTQEIDRGEVFSSVKSALGNDPMYNKLWGLKNTGDNEPASSRGNSSPTGVAGSDINAERVWEITKGSRAVRIAVIDTGVDYNHEDLKDNMWVNQTELNGTAGVDDDGNGYVDDVYGYDFANDDADPMDGNGHGTHCSGTIAGVHDNGVGVKGVMADAEIVAVKFLTDGGGGTLEGAIKAIDYAMAVDVDIMSNSWGGGGFSQALFDAIKRANEKGILFVAAAGNSASDNDTRAHYPSNYNVNNVIAVAATNYNDGLASFSCYGSDTVHVAAPGRNILSSTPNNQYQVFSGTSMATPHVSGILGLYLAKHGRADVLEVREKIMSSGIYNRGYGRKLISGARTDAYNFLTGVVTERPERPNPDAWQALGIDMFESEHPYASTTELSQEYVVDGARFIRVRVKKYDIERGYDFLTIKDSYGNIVDRISGKGEDYVSDYIEGDRVTIEFKSDVSVNKWGFQIDELEVIE